GGAKSSHHSGAKSGQHSQRLYVYTNGAYRAGEDYVQRRITELLAEKWKRRYADETIAWLLRSADRLNEHPPANRINVRNGIIVVKKRGIDLAPHDPELLTPVQLPVRYDPDATCPRIEHFLADVLPPSLRRLVEEIKAALPKRLHHFTFRHLRHTAGSLAASGGVAPHVLAKRLGHSDPTTTYKHYIHVYPADDEAAADTLDETFQRSSD
ncbi:MAG: tyrosine-type recombinase/integrase, partial [Solirubrobacterales bacterium]